MTGAKRKSVSSHTPTSRNGSATPDPDRTDPGTLDAGGGTAAYADYERLVAVFTEAGGQESVQRIVTAISRVGRQLDVFYRQQFIDLEISPGEWSVLTSLATEGPGAHLTPSRLADICGVSPSTMTHRLDVMVGRQLVHREPDPANRTRMLVTLAAAGWELFRRGVIEANVVESRVITPLNDAERRQLAGLLDRVVAGLRTN